MTTTTKFLDGIIKVLEANTKPISAEKGKQIADSIREFIVAHDTELLTDCFLEIKQ